MGGRGVKPSIEVSNSLFFKRYVDLISNGREHWDDGSVSEGGGGEIRSIV